ncbi:phospholipase carboxylesterase [Apiospora aurea]|uniref:Phospholipase carboxylesterase n=1 Tax=Apiospora aurea TaxID=335848 RepID=A0ABR1QJ07_9PEZI
MSPESKVFGPTGAHTHTVIFLHGRDSSCDEFADEFFESEASSPPGRRPDGKPHTLLELFPTVRWWFDMWSVEDPEERPEIQHDGLRQSIDRVLSVIREEEEEEEEEEEAAGVPRGRIFLCGISQGFATAVAALFAEGRGGLAGMIGLSSWMPFATRAEEPFGKDYDDDDTSLSSLTHLQIAFTGTANATTTGVNVDAIRQIPMLITHSVDDDVVPVQHGRRLRDILMMQGFAVEWKEYPDGGHWINEAQGWMTWQIFYADIWIRADYKPLTGRQRAFFVCTRAIVSDYWLDVPCVPQSDRKRGMAHIT